MSTKQARLTTGVDTRSVSPEDADGQCGACNQHYKGELRDHLLHDCTYGVPQ